MAAELMLILSAPASNSAEASSSERTPPPTVNGTKSWRAVRRTTSIRMGRASLVAVMSSNTISSAPLVACRCASSAGSPASIRSTNCTPLTTRPLVTSRQAMMRLVIPVLIARSFRLCGIVAKVLQNAQTGVAGFFRMELYAEDIVALHRGRKGLTVGGDRRDALDHRRAIGVREINKALVWALRAADANARPPPCGEIWFQPTCGTLSVVWKRSQRPSKSASPCVSGASVEPANCHCIPTQMPRNGMPRAIASSTASRTPLRGQPLAWSQKCPTPGSTRACGIAHLRGIVGDHRLLPKMGEGLAHAGQVAGFVIDERNHLQKSFGRRQHLSQSSDPCCKPRAARGQRP